jgi:opacity protein-like surface antigen
MKNIKKLFISGAAFLFLSFTANAQKGTLKFDLNYNYSVPLSSFKSDLIKENSPRGARGSIMYSFTDKLSAGIESGYQDYYQKYPRDIYSTGKTEQVSAVLTNSIQTTPLLVKAKYSLSNGSAIKPYISLGAGANLIDFNQYFGEFGNGNTNVGFIGEGGLGVSIPFGKTKASGIDIGATYDYAPYNKYGYHDLNSVNLKAGVYFPLH